METRTMMPILGRRMLTPLANLREEMDRLFNNWLATADLQPLHLFDEEQGFMPRVDARESETGLEITLEVPGVDHADLEIELTKTALLVRGQKKLESEEKGEGYFRKERRFGSFCREIQLPWEVDVATTAVDAKFANGVLEVKVAKPAEVKETSRKIAIGA